MIRRPSTARSRALLVIVLWAIVSGAVAAGCTQSHGPDASPDGALTPDAGHDAVLCLDRDGDGAADIACGGTDCDDLDPTIAPDRSVCVGPTVTETWVSGAVESRACPAICDARTGECAAQACGDGVLHEGLCASDDDCDLAELPYCAFRFRNAPRRGPGWRAEVFRVCRSHPEEAL